MTRPGAVRAVCQAAIVLAGVLAAGCGVAGDPIDVSTPFGEADCHSVAGVAEQPDDDPVRRREAVFDAVRRQGLDDAAYRDLAETCVRLRCPGSSPSPASPNPIGAPLPVEHADLGPDASWPCATGDIL